MNLPIDIKRAAGLGTMALGLVLFSGCAPTDEHAGHDHGDGEGQHTHEPVAVTPPAVVDDHAGHDHGDGEGQHTHDDGDTANEPAHVESGGHDDDADDHDHAEDDHADHVELTSEELAEYGIEIVVASGGEISLTRDLPGEVVFNPDGVAHVLPRVSGVVREVHKSLGDTVKAGDTLAILDSRELAQSITAYLAAVAKERLAERNFSREERLYSEQISTERTFLESQLAYDEARIETTRAERELHALGLSEQNIATLPDVPDESFTRYELRAPIDGMITERHLVRGEVVHAESDEPPFVIADLASVWVHLTVYARDHATIRPGQSVTIHARESNLATEGVIDFVSPSMQESTRTGTARIVIDNHDGDWRPGLFVTGQVALRRNQADIVVPRVALQTINGRTVIFVEEAPGVFEPRTVTTGAAQNGDIEIVSGLTPGERFAATNSMILKAELDRAALEHAGHVH